MDTGDVTIRQLQSVRQLCRFQKLQYSIYRHNRQRLSTFVPAEIHQFIRGQRTVRLEKPSQHQFSFCCQFCTALLALPLSMFDNCTQVFHRLLPVSCQTGNISSSFDCLHNDMLYHIENIQMPATKLQSEYLT